MLRPLAQWILVFYPSHAVYAPTRIVGERKIIAAHLTRGLWV